MKVEAAQKETVCGPQGVVATKEVFESFEEDALNLIKRCSIERY